MFTYVGLFRVAPIAREHLEKTPEYFEKIHKFVEAEGGTVERFLAVMGPWEYLGIFEYPISRPRSASSARSRSSRCSRPRRSPQRTSRCSGRRSSSVELSPQKYHVGPPSDGPARCLFLRLGFPLWATALTYVARKLTDWSGRTDADASAHQARVGVSKRSSLPSASGGCVLLERAALRTWAHLGSNQGPLACEASALPLSYAPESA